MAQYSARVCFNVWYHAGADEVRTHARVQALAETMLAVLRGSPRTKVIAIEVGGIEDVEEESD